MILNSLLEEAKQMECVGIGSKQKESIEHIVDCAYKGKNKSCVSVTLTLLYKKIENPFQDIRKHQDGMEGGFSGRTLDTKIITPFLTKENFSHNKESGWLTRSFEQPHPYDSSYPGKITPKSLKEKFLNLIHSIEEKNRGGVPSKRKKMCCLYITVTFKMANKIS
ncbi:MAG: hypothetical protein OXC92_05815 [Flavobacteriaceae bacterium]|nr:hypothetical protein [Flavobacteriaceae bacterium]